MSNQPEPNLLRIYKIDDGQFFLYSINVSEYYMWSVDCRRRTIIETIHSNGCEQRLKIHQYLHFFSSSSSYSFFSFQYSFLILDLITEFIFLTTSYSTFKVLKCVQWSMTDQSMVVEIETECVCCCRNVLVWFSYAYVFRCVCVSIAPTERKWLDQRSQTWMNWYFLVFIPIFSFHFYLSICLCRRTANQQAIRYNNYNNNITKKENNTIQENLDWIRTHFKCVLQLKYT